MNKKSIQIIAFIAFIGIAAAALYFGLKDGNASGSQAESSPNEPQTVTILKYSDYQCPACKAYIPAQEQLKRDFGDKIEIEYRHFPLSGFQYSRLASHAAEAARNQGQFREIHDKIFENQEIWSMGNARELFFEYAEEIGLDMEQFEEDIDSEEVAERVQSQRREGDRRLVSSTPTFFINGQKLQQNPQNYEQFKSIVELYMYRSN